ncbi:serine hydrolase [Streptomyces sp. NPDC088116]|uniref:serine hydrolase n=1 Tax=Streptomyces sp. NPDC088116 TaxID=3365825 RepID=UPI0038262484
MDLSVAVYDMKGGRETAFGADRTYVTASVVKVAVLAALLLRAQDTGRWLTAEEERLAAAMIERSDNDAATALRAAAGGVAGLDAAHARLGMTRTTAAPAWGLTRTTARDQLTLLRAVFGGACGPPVLNGDSRRFLARLMGRVVPGQDWGVSAAAGGDPAGETAGRAAGETAGGGWALKNGWLPRTGSGLWVVHSVGLVRDRSRRGSRTGQERDPVRGRPTEHLRGRSAEHVRDTSAGRIRDCLVAVLSDGHASLEEGIARVEEAAVSAVRRVGQRSG